MTTSPDQIRADIERTRAELSGDVDQLADAVDPRQMAHRQAEKVKDAVTGVKERVLGSDTEPGVTGSVARTPARAAGWTRDRTAGNPWAAGMLALGVGWMIGSLLPATSTERDAVGRLTDSAAPMLQETAGAAAGEMAEHLRAPVEEAVSAVKGSASDAVEAVKESAGPGASAGQHQD